MPVALRRELRECGFSFLSDAEVRKLSVQRIISPIAFDQFRNPLRGGLYDGALGPIDPNAVCQTCALNYKDCPGHIGHIELCAPVYNPLLFSQLHLLLQAKCFTCHRLRLSRPRLHAYLCKLLLLDRGHVEDALSFEKKVDALTNGIEDDRERCIAEWMEELMQEPKKPKLLSHVRTIRKGFVKDLFGAILSRKRCENCGAMRGRIRKVGYTKFFVKSGDIGDDFADEEDAFRGFDDREAMDPEPPAGRAETYLAQLDVYEHVRKLWENDFEAIALLYGTSFKSRDEIRRGWSIFFKTCIAVPPCRFRPPQLLAGRFTEHPHNLLLQKVLSANEALKSTMDVGKEDEGAEPRSEAGEEKEDFPGTVIPQKIDIAKVMTNWIALQNAVNIFIDSSRDESAVNNQAIGVRQLLERKEGLFRKHMMGKRVDHACRSVISPDPYIGTTEIGIPQRFATTLVYPERVTPWNVARLRKIVERGGARHPGANFVEMAKGRRMDLRRMTEEQRYALAARLLSEPGQTVYRHVVSGDVMLVNRQPTLHKPGIMAHKVRVVSDPSQQTIRMHYANCNTYNADFDGDEINCHLPQDELSRSEAYFIASANEQYIVPTDGSPLRGLIQDHVDAGVKLCIRDSFFEREEFYQLIQAATSGLPGIEVCSPGVRLSVPQPAILKPTPLWTGKQIFSMLIHMIAGGRPLMSFDGKSKMPADALGSGEGEHLVLVRRSQLLRGVLDKGSFGSANYGLVHAIQELYGSESAGKFLNGLARLLTYFLQFMGGHTCSIEDMWLSSDADQSRRRIIDASGELGRRAMRDLVLKEGGGEIQQLQKEADEADGQANGSDGASRLKHQILRTQVEAFISENPAQRGAKIDSHMIAALAPVNSDLLKACLPNLYIPFPTNSFALMVMTGAKGSTVNLSQISCALGQQSLEGRRVPFMSSGKTLPAFPIYETAPRAGGFVADRFLTGVRPAEYYFHCMAGREGLVDTAVKTSRSGYLQRCLIKFMEELRVAYDHTVRDAEGSVVQFLYGEDGVDPVQASYLSGNKARLDFLYKNRDVYVKKYGLQRPDTIAKIGARDTVAVVTSYAERHSRAQEALGNPKENIPVGAFVLTRRLKEGRSDWAVGSIRQGWFPAEVVRVHRPKEGHPTARYNVRILSDGSIIRKVPEVIKQASGQVLRVLKRALPDPLLSRAKGCPEFGYMPEKLAESVDKFGDDQGITDDESRHEIVKLLLQLKYLRSLANPGEAVGSIAGQSVGEPSTQMTLNTFHLAGHGGANVTLGIPRLREIIMTAAKEQKTPLLKIPVHLGVAKSQAEHVANQISRLYVEEVLHHMDGVQVTETIALDGKWQRVYNVRLRFEDLGEINRILQLSFEDIVQRLREHFVPKLLAVVNRVSKGKVGVQEYKASGGGSGPQDEGMSTEERKKAEVASSPGIEEEADEEVDEDDDEMDEDRGKVKKDRVGYDSDEDERPISAILAEREEHAASALEPAPKTPSRTPSRATNSSSSGSALKSTYTALKGDEHAGVVSFSLSLDASAPRLLLENHIQDLAKVVTIRAMEGIERASVLDISKETTFSQPFQYAVQTEGSNILKMLGSFSDVLDYDELECNDIAKISEIYGIEACRAAISKEITNVFGVYGISVDPRHLSLISDAMTFTGEYTPMNRRGISKSSSPYLQMSFETTTHFLLDAAMNGVKDNLASPSGALVLGRVPKLGTGMMAVMQQ